MTKKIWIVTSLVSLFFSAIVYVISVYQQKRIAVIDIIRLVNEFKMKEELEVHHSRSLDSYQSAADSLKRLLQTKSQDESIPKDQLQELYTMYMRSQQEFDINFERSNGEINEQVWKRLNPLLDDYGKKENLRLIIGANGMGTVLYNNDFYDHTNAVIKYVNSRYEKGN